MSRSDCTSAIFISNRAFALEAINRSEKVVHNALDYAHEL
jgi:hypothetical protein